MVDGDDAGFVTAYELSDGRLLIAGTERIQIWNISEGVLREELRQTVEKEIVMLEDDLKSEKKRKEPQSIVDVFVHENLNRLLVLYGHSGSYVMQPRYKDRFVIEDAQLWSLSPLRPLAPAFSESLSSDHSLYPLNNAVLIADAERVVTTSNNGDINIWSSKTGKRIRGPISHRQPVFWSIPSPDGQVIAVYGKSPEVNLWSLKTGERVGRPLTHDTIVKEVRFAGDRNVLVTWTEDGIVSLWDPQTGLKLPDDIFIGGGIRSVDVGLSGDLLITVNDPGVASIHRIGYERLFDDSLARLVDLSESVAGWTISEYGFEVRRQKPESEPRRDKETIQEAEPDWVQFRQWLKETGEKRSSFPGTAVSANTLNTSILSLGPSALAYFVLQSDPCNPEALMLLAEHIAFSEENDLIQVARLVGASDRQELNALAHLWANQSVGLATESEAFERRRTEVIKAITP